MNSDRLKLKIDDKIVTNIQEEKSEFDLFLKTKFKELEKFKKNINQNKIENENTKNLDSNLFFKADINTQTSSLVCAINNKRNENLGQNVIPNKNIKSFLNNYGQSSKNRPLFRTNLNINNNNEFNYELDNLVYESGITITNKKQNVEKNEITPSQNLINKMQNIYGILTKSPRTQTETPSDSHNINSLYSLNSLDKTFTIKNLDQNFGDIFKKIYPEFKDRSISHNNKQSYLKNNFEIEGNSPDEQIHINITNDPVIDKKFNKLYNKNKMHKRSISICNTPKDKIMQKIGENRSLLKNLFTKNGNMNSVSFLYNQNKNSISTYSNKNYRKKKVEKDIEIDKICQKNEFYDLRTNISKINSLKVKKILNLKNFEE